MSDIQFVIHHIVSIIFIGLICQFIMSVIEPFIHETTHALLALKFGEEPLVILGSKFIPTTRVFRIGRIKYKIVKGSNSYTCAKHDFQRLSKKQLQIALLTPVFITLLHILTLLVLSIYLMLIVYDGWIAAVAIWSLMLLVFIATCINGIHTWNENDVSAAIQTDLFVKKMASWDACYNEMIV